MSSCDVSQFDKVPRNINDLICQSLVIVLLSQYALDLVMDEVPILKNVFPHIDVLTHMGHSFPPNVDRCLNLIKLVSSLGYRSCFLDHVSTPFRRLHHKLEHNQVLKLDVVHV